MKNNHSPLRILIIIAISIFVSEAIVMIILRFFLPEFSPWVEILLDPFLLLVLLFPSFYFFLFRHLLLYISKLKLADEALRKSKERYKYLSISDGLTKLYNSRHFYKQLKTEMERAGRYNRPLSLLLLDIDNFKNYNDSYGHLEGDNVLVRLGRVIRECMREADSAYRYGGEEFTLILPETEGQEALNIARRIRRQFEAETFSPVSAKTVHVRVSVGVAQLRSEEKLSVFVNRADQAMYMAKKQGKNRVYYAIEDSGI